MNAAGHALEVQNVVLSEQHDPQRTWRAQWLLFPGFKGNRLVWVCVSATDHRRMPRPHGRPRTQGAFVAAPP